MGNGRKSGGKAGLPFGYTVGVLTTWYGGELCSFMHCRLTWSRILRVFHAVIHAFALRGCNMTRFLSAGFDDCIQRGFARRKRMAEL